MPTFGNCSITGAVYYTFNSCLAMIKWTTPADINKIINMACRVRNTSATTDRHFKMVIYEDVGAYPEHNLYASADITAPKATLQVYNMNPNLSVAPSTPLWFGVYGEVAGTTLKIMTDGIGGETDLLTTHAFYPTVPNPYPAADVPFSGDPLEICLTYSQLVVSAGGIGHGGNRITAFMSIAVAIRQWLFKQRQKRLVAANVI